MRRQLKKLADYLVNQGVAARMTSYKLRDWIFSRQRYWGEPIPLFIAQRWRGAGSRK